MGSPQVYPSAGGVSVIRRLKRQNKKRNRWMKISRPTSLRRGKRTTEITIRAVQKRG